MKINNIIQTNFKINVAYEQWLSNFVSAPNINELNQMEKDLNSIANNPNYHPIQGA